MAKIFCSFLFLFLIVQGVSCHANNPKDHTMRGSKILPVCTLTVYGHVPPSRGVVVRVRRSMFNICRKPFKVVGQQGGFQSQFLKHTTHILYVIFVSKVMMFAHTLNAFLACLRSERVAEFSILFFLFLSRALFWE